MRIQTYNRWQKIPTTWSTDTFVNFLNFNGLEKSDVIRFDNRTIVYTDIDVTQWNEKD